MVVRSAVTAAILTALVAAAPVFAGSIQGTQTAPPSGSGWPAPYDAGGVFTPFGVGLARDGCNDPHKGCVPNPAGVYQSAVPISANAYGNLIPGGYGSTTSYEGSPVGEYYVLNLYQSSSATYGMLFHEKDLWPRFLKYGVVVNGATFYDRFIQYKDYATCIGGDVGATTWSQSFVATGTSLVQVGLHQTTEFGPDVEVSIHDGDPSGTQIGPSRTIPTVVVNPSSAYWSHGEVPVTPGHTYCVSFTSYDPAKPMVPFFGQGRIQGGIAYPDGQTWRDGMRAYNPIKMVLCQDDDGIVTCVSTKKTNSGSLPLSFVSVTTLGQTFIAHGSSFLSMSLLVGSTDPATHKLQVSVHDGPGPNGLGGTQIGPAKNIKAIDWNARSGAIWAPGEVPLQEGHLYYMKVVSSSIQYPSFTVYYVNQNEYSGGQMYVDGVAQPNADLSTTICSEEYTGSLSVPSVQISDRVATPGTTSATITWTTSVATTTNYAQYYHDTPYQSSADATSGTSHSVTVSNLQPNTQYHYRVVSKVSGYRDAISRDFVFVTDPDTTNLVPDPGFEASGMGPWVKYGGGDQDVRGAAGLGGISAHGGSRYYAGWCNGLQIYGGVYQVVQVTPGLQMNLRAWLWSWQRDNVGAMWDYTCHCRIGIDPNGGTDPNSVGIQWSPWVVAQDLFAEVPPQPAFPYRHEDGVWTPGWMATVAASNSATIFLEGGSAKATAWTIFGFDDVVLTQVQPIDVGRIADLKGIQNGSFVRLTDKIVTATKDQVGAAYIEESDRSCGLRVESNSAFTIGYRVTLAGAKDTKPTGEVYLRNAVLLSSAPGTEVRSLATVAKNIGTAGPGNVAMLMRTAGMINMDDNLVFYVNDGSLPGMGLKLDTSTVIWPVYGATYAVTGIVQLQGSSPSNATPVLHPRWNDDLNPY